MFSYLSYFKIVLLVVAFMSGILSLFREILLIYRPEVVPERVLFWRCMWIAFIISAVTLWGIEHRDLIEANGKIEQLTRPKFILTLGPAVNFIQREKDVTLCFLAVQIANSGAASAVRGFKVHYESPTLNADVQHVNLTSEVPLNTPSGPFIVGPKELINMQTGVITQGDFRTGRLAIVIPGNKLDEFNTGAKLTVTVWDYLGNPYKLDYVSSQTNQGPILYAPGEVVPEGSGGMKY